MAEAGSQLPSVHSLAEINFIVELGKVHMIIKYLYAANSLDT